ncbi:MAG: transposase [Clostridia bacterium]|nr:transposase [Clostridia bacterium]
MEKPIRKPNRLKHYDYGSNGMYFITICTKNKAHILGKIVGATIGRPPRICLSRCGEITKYAIENINSFYPAVSVVKYVIMPNHIHLIVTVNKPDSDKNGTSRAPSPTNAVIPRVISTFKRLVNKDTGKDTFQRSYHDHIIRNEKDYEKIWEYIDTNPMKWESDCFYSDNPHKGDKQL